MIWLFIYWILCFVMSLTWMGIQLNWIFAHDDLDDGFQEPYELSEILFKYTPIEIILQGWMTLLSIIFFRPYWFLYFIVMTYFNFKYWRGKKLTQHFMTDREYSKRKIIERITKYKLVYYIIIVFFSLVFAIINIAEIIGNIMSEFGS